MLMMPRRLFAAMMLPSSDGKDAMLLTMCAAGRVIYSDS